MKEYKYIQKWDYFTAEKIIVFDEDEFVYSYSLLVFDYYINEIKIEDVYVNEKYRNQGYFNKIMNEILEYCKHNNFNTIYLQVFNKIFIKDKYRKLGFKKFSKIDTDGYFWMKKIMK